MVMALWIVSDQNSAIRGTLASALVALARPKLTPGDYLAAGRGGGAIITRGKRDVDREMTTASPASTT
jgi:hypothetical protein